MSILVCVFSPDLHRYSYADTMTQKTGKFIQFNCNGVQSKPFGGLYGVTLIALIKIIIYVFKKSLYRNVCFYNVAFPVASNECKGFLCYFLATLSFDRM